MSVHSEPGPGFAIISAQHCGTTSAPGKGFSVRANALRFPQRQHAGKQAIVGENDFKWRGEETKGAGAGPNGNPLGLHEAFPVFCEFGTSAKALAVRGKHRASTLKIPGADTSGKLFMPGQELFMCGTHLSEAESPSF